MGTDQGTAYPLHMKSRKIYLTILGLWAVLVMAAAPALLSSVRKEWGYAHLDGFLAALCALFIAYFWLNGTKDVVYALGYHFLPKLRSKMPERGMGRGGDVVLIYCTCNDFDPHSLEESMKQTVPCRTVILDDSSKSEYWEEINQFEESHPGVKVCRRADRKGFKAGNMNNYLATAEYDYFVILDSDEIIPPDFVSRCLDYFAAEPDTGIVQGNHIASRNRTPFMRMFSPGVDSHWPAYQAIKDRYGFLSLLGHGAMVSRDCYKAAGGFPPVVAEDLCFTIKARNAGYFAKFARDVICQEEYPVDYLAFRKRHAKWTQGNMEFIANYTLAIIKSPMRWFEKLDIVLFTYSLPLTAFFFLYLVLNVVVFPAIGKPLQYPFWMLVPTIVFLAAPMLNDWLTYRKWPIFRTLTYTILVMCLYGSVFLTSLRSSIASVFGGAVFIVTPKKSQSISLWESLKANCNEIAFSLLLLGASLWFDKSALPCILLIITGFSGTFLTLMGYHAPKEEPQPAPLFVTEEI